MERKMGKRIVSKGEYVKAQSLSLFLCSSVLVCGLGIVLLLVNIPSACALDAQEQSGLMRYNVRYVPTITHAMMAFFWCLFLLGPLGYTLRVLWRESHKSRIVIRDLQPLTRANTAELPASDSLVRASSVPQQNAAVRPPPRRRPGTRDAA